MNNDDIGPDGACAAGGIAAFINLCQLFIFICVGLYVLIEKWLDINKQYKKLHGTQPKTHDKYGFHFHREPGKRGNGLRERFIQAGNKLVPEAAAQDILQPCKSTCKIFALGTGERGRWTMEGEKIA